jgi:hypothetical protein
VTPRPKSSSAKRKMKQAVSEPEPCSGRRQLPPSLDILQVPSRVLTSSVTRAERRVSDCVR